MRRVFVFLIGLNLCIGAVAFLAGQPTAAGEVTPQPLPLPADEPRTDSGDRGVIYARDGEALARLDAVLPDWMGVEVADPMSEPPLDPVVRDAMLQSAADEFGVPFAVLKAIGDIESGWTMRGGAPSRDFAYGVMGLRDNGVVDTLQLASDLLGTTSEALQHDALTNIRGAAAVLRLFAGDAVINDPDKVNDPAAWVEAVAAYSGLKSDQLRMGYTAQVYTLMGELEIAARIQRSSRVTVVARPDGCIGYASVTDFAPASPYNFDEGERVAIDRVVIHIGEGTYWGGLGWFQNPAASVSAHYFVSETGRVGQSVCEQDTAWHAGMWSMNQRSIGIEHAGYSGITAFSEAQYQATAAIVREVTARYQIPRDREHIIGHYQVDPPRRANCPGPLWNWDYFMQLVGPNDHLNTYQGELALGAQQTRTMTFEDRWQVMNNGETTLLFDAERVSGDLTFKMVVRDAFFNVVAEADSSATGRAVLRQSGLPAGPLFVHFVRTGGRKGDYRVRVTANARPTLTLDGPWQDSFSNIARWDAELGASPIPYHVEFERLTGTYELNLEIYDGANTLIGTIPTVDGRAKIGTTSANALRVRLSGLDPLGGSYRLRLRSGPVDNSSAQLLKNTGFEIQPDENVKIPAQWKLFNLTTDSIRCNIFSRPNNKPNRYFAYSDECAFRFVGGENEASRLKQVVRNVAIDTGDTITLASQVWARNLVDGAQVSVKIRYLDALIPATKLTLPIAAGSYEYSPVSLILPVSGAVDRVIVQVINRAPAGKMHIDDVTLTWQDGAAAAVTIDGQTGGTLPPPVPDAFRR